jgi:putative transposase
MTVDEKMTSSHFVNRKFLFFEFFWGQSFTQAKFQGVRAFFFKRISNKNVLIHEKKLWNHSMARKKRICLPNVTYHCYSRCIEKRNLFSADFVKQIAVSVINVALEKYTFELVQLEFVGNHFHLIIKTTDSGETISRIMQYIKARITERFNRAANRTGTFWNERFKSIIIEQSDDPCSYFLYLMWQIAYNPVRKGQCNDPRDSEFGTIRVYLEENYVPKVRISLHDFFQNLGNSFSERVRKFLMYEKIYRERLL